MRVVWVPLLTTFAATSAYAQEGEGPPGSAPLLPTDTASVTKAPSTIDSERFALCAAAPTSANDCPDVTASLHAAIRSCAANNPDTTGTLSRTFEVRLTIANDGRARDLRFFPGNTSAHPFGLCVAGAIDALRFTTPADPISVRFAASTLDEPPPVVVGMVSTSTRTVATSTRTGPGDAWERYHDAFMAIARGQSLKGRAALQALIEKHGEHPATDFAAEILATLDGVPKAPPPKSVPEEPDNPFDSEEPTDLARAELAVYQTMFGITGGALLCGGISCEDARLVVGLVALGGTAGLTLSMLGTQGGITPGRAQTLNAAAGWGIFNGIALANLTGLDGGAAPGFVLFSQLAGIGAGLAVNTLRDPRGGDVSRATSAGLWSGVLTLFVHGAFEFDADDDLFWGTMMLFSDLGLAAGATLGVLDKFSMTRGRVLLIDAGGIVGGLIGMGVPVLIQNEVGDAGLFFGSAIVGTLAGLTLTTYFTRDWDVVEDPLDISVGIVPTREGGGSIVLGGRF